MSGKVTAKALDAVLYGKGIEEGTEVEIVGVVPADEGLRRAAHQLR